MSYPEPKQIDAEFEIFEAMNGIANAYGDQLLIEVINDWFTAKMNGLYQVQEVKNDL